MIRTRSVLDKELAKLQANIVRLSSMVEQALEQSMHALETRNVELAQTIIAGDLLINTLRYEIEESALLTLSTQSPRAGDLRTVIAAIHIAIELERMGDHASGISRLVERMAPMTEIVSLHSLPKMAKRVKKMISLAIDAFVAGDDELARRMMVRDEKIDRGYRKLYTQAIKEMQDDSYVEIATYLLWVGHSLERVGDRTVNIAERVVFMVTGVLQEEGQTTDFDL
ncbi:MAG: phosphate signaling complex protein PhoU [Candidatus Promineifilaceae bacterium]